MLSSGWSDKLLEQRLLEGLSETVSFGEDFALRLEKGDIVALEGPLGSGKTSLVGGIVHGLRAINPGEVASPTFAYLHIYETERFPLYHFDLYRLRGVEDFLALGFDEFLDGDGVCCIEWSEKIAPLLCFSHYAINLQHVDGQSRALTLFRRSAL